MAVRTDCLNDSAADSDALWLDGTKTAGSLSAQQAVSRNLLELQTTTKTHQALRQVRESPHGLLLLPATAPTSLCLPYPAQYFRNSRLLAVHQHADTVNSGCQPKQNKNGAYANQ
jgi:hypothetical protein